MGTRSLTRVIPRQEGLSFNEGHEKIELAFVNMYRHLDGYPEGHGLDLADCVYALEDRDVEDLSSYEIRGLKDLLEYAKHLLDHEDYIEEIIRKG